MSAVLVPFDGSPPATRALRHAMTMGASIHLLNVQKLAESPALLLHRTQEEIEQHQLGYGHNQLAAAREVLQQAGMPFTEHVRVGEPAEEIAKLCETEKLDGIVMGTLGLSAIANLMLGSTTTKVINLASVPVTLVK
jgi:nucleotide-binding universal stress UspA family protein